MICKVGELFELVNGYAFKSGEFKDEGIPVLKIKNIKAGKIIYDNCDRVDEEYLNKKVDKVTVLNDILVTMTGNRHDGTPETWVGKVAWWGNPKKYLINQRVGILRLKPNLKINTRFIAYQLSNWEMQKHFISIATSSGGQANLSPNQILESDIWVPSIEVQNNIASFIGGLEDKIEINNQITKKMEKISEELFKRYFNDYEFPNELGLPYRSTGGEMVESELGKIPKGWFISTVNELGEIVGGGTPSKKQDEYYMVDGIPWITPKDLSSNKSKFIYKGNLDISALGLAKSSAKLMPKGTVLLSSRAPIGYIAFAGADVTTNQGFKSIVPNKGYSEYFIYFKLNEILPIIEANAGGSTFKEISGSGLKAIQIILPEKEVVDKFHNLVLPLFNQIKNLELETGNVAVLRDTLLPKLLSGEIEIPDESVVEPS